MKVQVSKKKTYEHEAPSPAYTARMRAQMEQTSRQTSLINEYTARQKAQQDYTTRMRAAEAAAELARQKKRKKSKYLVATFLALFAVVVLAVVLRNVSTRQAYSENYAQGMAYYNTGRYDDALVSLRKAQKLGETDECLLLMAACYRQQGSYDRALEILRGMDTRNSAVAAQIAEVEAQKTAAARANLVRINGTDYDITTTSLVLDGLQLGNTAIAEAAQLYALENLSAVGNGITSVSELAGLGGLTTLNLSNNSLTDLSPLSRLTGLRTLYLDNNPLYDLSPLYSLTNLTTLSLKGVELDEQQLSALSAALPNCAIHSEKATQATAEISIGGQTFRSDVTELSLSSLAIGDISALANCTALVRLDISNNYISDLTPLMNIPGLRWLNLAGNSVSDVRPLMGLGSLTYINAQDNLISSTVSLGALTNLTELYLDYNYITDFTGLKKLKNLETLGLSDTGITDEGLNSLARLDNLRLLYLEGNPAITGEVMDQLKSALPQCMIRHSELTYSISMGQTTVQTDSTTMDLSGQGITDLTSLMTCTDLQSLNLANNKVYNVYPLAYCYNLVSLNLSSNCLSDISPLASLTQLRYLNLANNQLYGIGALMNLTNLQELHLEGNTEISQEDLDMLRAALPYCTIYFY